MATKADVLSIRVSPEEKEFVRQDAERQDISVSKLLYRIVNLVNALKGTVSDATLLAQIPFVKDVQAELDAISAQKKENMSLYLGGSLTQEDEDNE